MEDMNTIFYETGLKAIFDKTNSLTHEECLEILDEIKEIMTSEILKYIDRAYEYVEIALKKGGSKEIFLRPFAGYVDLIGDMFGNDTGMSDVYKYIFYKYLYLLYK